MTAPKVSGPLADWLLGQAREQDAQFQTLLDRGDYGMAHVAQVRRRIYERVLSRVIEMARGRVDGQPTENFSILVHHERGAYWTESPDHPGCFASGDDLTEVLQATAEALVIGGWIEVLR